MSARGLLLFVLVPVALGAGCTDPVIDDVIAEQGEESDTIPKGPLHRAGQRCVVCHEEGGAAGGSPFTLAGTVFAQPKRQVGVNDASVRFTDAAGTSFTAKTNCVGNFFVRPDEWTPRFPVLVEVVKGTSVRAMQSPIGRERDCASCHALAMPPPDPFSQVGHVYLFDSDERGAYDGDISCSVNPIREGTQ